MAKNKFGKYKIARDKKGFTRYYRDGKRVKNQEFEQYQREYLERSRKQGFELQKKILRFPSTKNKEGERKKSGRVMPKYLQRHFKHQINKTNWTIPLYQEQINNMPAHQLLKIINFVNEWGEDSKRSEVDIDRLMGQIPALAQVGVQMYFLGKKVSNLNMVSLVSDRNIKLIKLLEETGIAAKIYTHIFPVSYPEGKFKILKGDYLVTDMGLFDDDKGFRVQNQQL
jgi:hypothetical protein